MMSPIYSQKSSPNLSKDSCIVPVSTLRNALLVLQQRNNCYEEIKIVRDSVSIMSQQLVLKDSIISNNNQTINLYIDSEKKYIETVKLKESIAEEYKRAYIKQRKLKWGGIAIGTIGVIFAVIK
jgi:hypothetical protein